MLWEYKTRGPLTTLLTAIVALDDALVWIGEKYGTALESLRWGDAHQATHDHTVLGEAPADLVGGEPARAGVEGG